MFNTKSITGTPLGASVIRARALDAHGRIAYASVVPSPHGNAESPAVLVVLPKYRDTRQKSYEYTFPLGIPYVVASAEQRGYQPEVLNLNHHDGTTEELLSRRLSSRRYDIVATGGISLHLRAVRAVLDTAKNHPTRPSTILGGAIITSEPELIFDALAPDYGVIGEGEEAFPDLIAKIHEHSDAVVHGVIFRRDGTVVQTPPRPPVELDRLHWPSMDAAGFGEWVDHLASNRTYCTSVDVPRVYPLLASRGCPYRCTFCYHFEKYRQRSLDDVFAELECAVPKYRINSIALFDDCFAIKRERLSEFCRRITDLRARCAWPLYWQPQLTVRDVDDEMLAELKQAGCEAISYGFESYDAGVLKSMNKPITPAQIDRALRLTRKHGLFVQANFIFGDTAETLESARRTLDYWRESGMGEITLDFIQPYPGSEIYRRCIEKGVIKDRLKFIENDLGRRRLNFTDNMSDAQFHALEREIFAIRWRYASYVSPTSVTRQGDTFTFELECPHCHVTRAYPNIRGNMTIGYRFDYSCRSCAGRMVVVSPWLRIAARFWFGRLKLPVPDWALDFLLRR
jgi:anaerobic magnesium-protoporphyrin IX monomethyl ester cyclase